MLFHLSLIGWASPYIYDSNYRTYGAGNWWAKYIYRFEWRHNWRKCHFECHHDDDCEFFVNAYDHCFYGRFSYSGAALGTWNSNSHLYFKNCKFFNGGHILVLEKHNEFFMLQRRTKIPSNIIKANFSVFFQLGENFGRWNSTSL